MRNIARELFKGKSPVVDNAIIGIRPKDSNNSHFTSKCRKCAEGETCDISFVEWKERKTPILTLFGPVFYKKQVLKCNAHNCFIDFFEFELGEDDEFLPQTTQAFDLTNCGLIKYGNYIYTHSCWTWLFNQLLIRKKGRNVRKALIIKYLHLYQNLFSNEEYDKIFKLLDLPKKSYSKALKKLISTLIPSTTTFQRWARDIGFQHIVPLAQKLKKTFGKFGSRFYSFDATFKFLKAVKLLNGTKTKLCLLTIKDEWGNYVGWAFIPVEGHEYIVPALAEVVYNTLLLGPFRSEQQFFVFTSDNAKDNKNIPLKVFKCIQNKYNEDDRYLWNADRTHLYDLKWLGINSKVLLFTYI